MSKDKSYEAITAKGTVTYFSETIAKDKYVIRFNVCTQPGEYVVHNYDFHTQKYLCIEKKINSDPVAVNHAHGPFNLEEFISPLELPENVISTLGDIISS